VRESFRDAISPAANVTTIEGRGYLKLSKRELLCWIDGSWLC